MRKLTSPLGRFVIAAGAAFMLGLAPAAFADETVALKNALYGAGYNITNVSPRMDDSTRAALTKFQKDHGLQATGIIDEETKKALGMISVKVAAAATPSTPAKASAPAKTKAAAPVKEEKPAEDDVVEEEDDGGWSLW
jgi:peptidoglycan hydrolase-like protein with peptidoglycan-binding domain